MKRKKDYAKRIVISWAIMFVLGLLLGIGIGTLVGKTIIDEEQPKENFFNQEVQEVKPTLAITPECTKQPELNLLGEYRITAYCGCEKCCGEWAKNRPDGIVKGAAGIELIPGYSAASLLPFGTELYIEDYGNVVVQDRTASWVVDKYEGKVVDVYFNNHDEALAFGLKYSNVYQIESEDMKND